MHLDSMVGTYVYRQSIDLDQILIVINTNVLPQTISISNPGLSKPRDILNNHEISMENDLLKIHLPGKSGSFISE